jgi:protease-4
MTDSEREILQNLIDDIHSQFVKSVAEGRNIDETVIRSIADGRVFSGRRAMEMGLVDGMGNLEVAIKRAAQLAGIDGEPNVVYPPGQKPRFIDLFIEETLHRLQFALQKQSTVGLQYLWRGFN